MSFFTGKWTVFKTADSRWITRTISCDTPLEIPNADEIVRDVCAKYVQGDCITYEFVNLNNDLWKMLDKIKFKSIKVKKHYLPLNILNSRMHLMELRLVTDKYAFYMRDEDEKRCYMKHRKILKNVMMHRMEKKRIDFPSFFLMPA